MQISRDKYFNHRLCEWNNDSVHSKRVCACYFNCAFNDVHTVTYTRHSHYYSNVRPNSNTKYKGILFNPLTPSRPSFSFTTPASRRLNAGLRHSVLLQPHNERNSLKTFFTNSWISRAGKGLKNGRVLTPPLLSSTPIKTPLPQTYTHYNRRNPLYPNAKKNGFTS